MIHYHGTPCGGTRQDAAKFLQGRHALVSYYRPEDMPIVAEVCKTFVLDNGAFSVWKSGAEMDVDGYIKFVLDWWRHPGFQWALIPDSIDGDEADNDALIREWPAKLCRHGHGVPVWHLHEDIRRLVRLCHIWKTVAIGSSGQWATPGTPAWWARISEAMSAICDEQGRPIANLHGLRMLNTEIFTRLPLASADSTNAVMNAGSLSRFGMYLPPTSAQRAAVIAERIEAYNSAPCWVDQPKQEALFS